jgi:hypothetical protein
MSLPILMVVSADPRESGRAAEAVRIAAGVGAWKKADITLYLRGPAVLVLDEAAEDLPDGDHYVRYLPLLRDWGRPVYVQEGEPLLAQLGETTLPFEEIDDLRLAELAAQARYLLRH